jgi:hypothetical protein
MVNVFAARRSAGCLRRDHSFVRGRERRARHIKDDGCREIVLTRFGFF